ncbi:MAG TPA: hypothetical protein VMU99_07210 [Acidimicrobiales bacterium]|nr:hypothetical protein [Acidimicrobiales bacterium]
MDDFPRKRADDAFRNAIPKSLDDKNCILRELIFDYPPLVDESTRIQSEANGLYEFCAWHNPPAVFMAFVVIEFKEAAWSPEVIVGWAVAAGLAFDSHSFILIEPSVDKCYSRLFEALWNSGLHHVEEAESALSASEARRIDEHAPECRRGRRDLDCRRTGATSGQKGRIPSPSGVLSTPR